MRTSYLYPVVIAAAFVLTGCAKEAAPPDAKLAMLRARMDAATTQTDMNEISHETFQHMDRKLSKLENLVRSDLHDAELVDQFNKAGELWREYREAQSQFAYSLYGSGSIRGLVYNSSMVALTEDRLNDLQRLWPEPKYREDGQGGWDK